MLCSRYLWAVISNDFALIKMLECIVYLLIQFRIIINALKWQMPISTLYGCCQWLLFRGIDFKKNFHFFSKQRNLYTTWMLIAYNTLMFYFVLNMFDIGSAFQWTMNNKGMSGMFVATKCTDKLDGNWQKYFLKSLTNQ